LKNFIITLAILSLFFFGEIAKAQFTLSGEYRPRTEYRHGYRSLADSQMNAGYFIDQRARINFDFKSERYSFKLVLQDVRTWGAEPQLVRGDGKWTTLHEAWAKVNFNSKFSLKLGRQEIIYDDHRIFGNVGWTQQARSHDAAIIQFADNGWKADVGFAFNQDRPQSNTTYYSVIRSYKTFQTIWINKKTENFNGSFLFLNNGMEGGTVDDPKTFYSQTIGTRLGATMNPWSGHLVYYYQGGKMSDGVTRLNASLVGFDLGYKLTNSLFVQVGYERQSGNSELNQDPNTNNAFTPFYGTNHKFNGFMDYFYVGNFIGSVGLNDLYFHTDYTISKVVLTAFVHGFSAANDVADPLSSGALDNYLGTEVDLVLSYNMAKDMNFKLGYSQMFATTTMEAVKGGSKDATSNWAWLMVTLKPKFFSTADKDEHN
jgi:alginate export protein